MSISEKQNSQRSGLRKLVLWLHVWVGTLVAGILFLIATTGLALAWMDELFEWQYPDLLDVRSEMTTTDADMYLGPGLLIESALESGPEGFMPLGVLMPHSRIGVGMASVYGLPAGAESAEDVRMRIVDPVTGEYRGSFLLDDAWGHILSHLHGDLLIGSRGAWVTAVVGLGLVFFALSGLYLWLPKRVTVWKFRRRAKLLRNLYMVHSILGVCCGIILALYGVTGAVLAKPGWFGSVLNDATVAPDWPEVCESVVSGSPATLDLAYSVAQSTFPDRRLTYVDLPRPQTPFYYLQFKKDGDLDTYGGDGYFWMHHQDSSLRQAFDISERALNEQVESLVFSLHTGQTLGRFGRVFTILFALALMCLSMSGLLLHGIRYIRKRGYPPVLKDSV